MSIIYDLTGKVFDNLTVIGKSNKRNKHYQMYWKCLCVCGKECYKLRTHLIRQKRISCGCLTFKFRADMNKTHGMHKTSEYNSWSNMRQRCQNPNNHVYHHYGGRGIKVCERWEDFGNFIADMGRKPTPKHSIDRIDVNGNYEPSNCRWATQKEQNNNRSNNRYITYKNKTNTLSQWSDILQINQKILRKRIEKHGIESSLNQAR